MTETNWKSHAYTTSTHLRERGGHGRAVLRAGGRTYAAFKLPNNSVGAAQLKDGAVSTKKIGNGAVTASKLKLTPSHGPKRRARLRRRRRRPGLAYQRRWPLRSVHSCMTGTGSDDVASPLRGTESKR
jgi:hypothetical protein